MKILPMLLMLFTICAAAKADSRYSAEYFPCYSQSPADVRANLATATYTQKTQTYYYYRGQIAALKSLLESRADFGATRTSNSDAENYVINLLRDHQEQDVLLIQQKIRRCAQSVEAVAEVVEAPEVPSCIDKTAIGIQDELILEWDCARESREDFKSVVGAFHIQRANLMENFIRGRMAETYVMGSYIRTDGRTVDVSQLGITQSTAPILIPWTYEMNMAYPIFAKTESDYVACNDSTFGAISIYELKGSHCK